MRTYNPLPKIALQNVRRVLQLFLLLAVGGFVMMSCSGDEKTETSNNQSTARTAEASKPADDGKGVGPVNDVQLGALDEALATKGKEIFDAKCAACHRMTDQKVVGPGLAGVTERRKPEWIMNMIINPEEMTKKDPTAKKLLAEHLTQMTNQNVNEQDARALLEYFRQNDAS
jgi:mono/diheme cytochrome c family protein